MSDKNNRKENTFKKKAEAEAESLEVQVIDTEEKKEDKTKKRNLKKE